MHHDLPLITTIAGAFAGALVLGFAAARLRLPPLVGYLLAGVLIGPFTPGFVADTHLAGQLAEIGVMLLMFGVGLHFSVDDLLAVRRIAIPGAVVQMAVATALGAGLALAWGWTPMAALVLGICLSVASTVVLLRALESRGMLDTTDGRIAVGWLVVEDLAMVLVLVLLPPLAAVMTGQGGGDGGPGGLAGTIALTLLRVGLFVALMLVLGRRVLPWLLWQAQQTGSREVFTLCVVAVAVGIAYGATALFGVSFALGAFFAGMVLRESPFSQRAGEETLPLRDAFAVLFFVSVGMLFDPRVLLEQPGRVLGVVAVIVVGKSVAAAALVLALRHPAATALTVSASLAQIGEFSFILAALGLSLGVLPPEGQSLVVAGALISMALNPLLFAAVAPLQEWLDRRALAAGRGPRRDDPLAALPDSTREEYLARQVVLVGHGRVGSRVAAALRAAGVPVVVADRDRDRVEALREAGHAAVCGDAAQPEVLVQAHVARARLLMVATGDCVGVRQMVDTARSLNAGIDVVVRAPSEDEARLLERELGVTALQGEQELARALAARALQAGGGG